MNPHRNLVLLVVALVSLTACSSETLEQGKGAPPTSSASPSSVPTPTVSGPDASIVVQVDCGTDGVAGVDITYGTSAEQVLVGRNPTTLSVGGIESFDRKYGTGPGYGDADLKVTVEPTTGTCRTTLTDYSTGEVLRERDTAGRAVLQAVVRYQAIS